MFTLYAGVTHGDYWAEIINIQNRDIFTPKFGFFHTNLF